MYYPYFRGKQFELITIRDTADIMAEAGFVPIIEPVKETLRGLHKALTTVCDANGRAIVIINPYVGDHQDNRTGITDLLTQEFTNNAAISAGILLRDDMNLEEALTLFEAHAAHNPIFVHAGFGDQKGLADRLGSGLKDTCHVFIEKHASTLYRKPFTAAQRVLVRDGFQRLKNSEYANIPSEEFSELHITYGDLGMKGFGDFLMVGDSYSEGGGPAYAVAIHLTYIDPDRDDVMYIYHFVSTTNDTPTDPAGKFAQALEKLITKLEAGNSKLLETSAIKEFRDLHAKGHFPGLGYVKKLSMNHHIETLANFFA